MKVHVGAHSDLLKGRRIVVTRPIDGAEPLKDALAAHGAEVMLVPSVRIEPPSDWGPLDAALGILADFDWVVFTSVNAVRIVLERIERKGVEAGAWKHVRVAVVGESTQEALTRAGIRVDLVPTVAQAEAVVTALGQVGVRGGRILLPQSAQGRAVLASGLRDLGADVVRVDTYRTVSNADDPAVARDLADRRWDAVTFTSPSTVHGFVEIARKAQCDPSAAPAFCIGNVTAAAARGAGFEVAKVSPKADALILAECVVRHFQRT